MKYKDLKVGDVVRIKTYFDNKEEELITVLQEDGFYDLVKITPDTVLDYGWTFHNEDLFEILEYYGNSNPMNLIPEQYKI